MPSKVATIIATSIVTTVYVALLILFLFVPNAGASEEHEAAGALWAEAWGATHAVHGGDREIYHNPPSIHIVSQADLCRVVFGPSGEADCPARGAYTKGIIYVLDIVPTDVYVMGILFHEMLHAITTTVAKQQGRYPHLGDTRESRLAYCWYLAADEADVRIIHAAWLWKNGRPDLAEDLRRGIKYYTNQCIREAAESE